METCSLCTAKHFAKTYCNRHYIRFLKYGDPLALNRNIGEGETPDERFWSRVDRIGSCWIWQGTVTKYGYGTVTYQGRRWQAHRLAWFLRYNVRPQYLLHSCDNRRCVNIAHLREGSHAENMADMMERDRQARGERNGHAVLTEVHVLSIREMLRRGRNRRSVAKQFGVAATTIGSIAQGKSWKYLPIN